MKRLKIDLYTEISCPWCIIGQHRLDRVLQERFPNVKADIEHHPVLLVADCPKEGLRIAELLKSRYGITDPKQAWARPEAEARLSGLDLDLSRQPMHYPTLAGHTLVRLARPLGTQHALAVALSKAYFMEARNIADPETLADLGSKHGFERTVARQRVEDPVELGITQQEAAESSAKGVRSVPHFVFGGHIALNGGQREDALAAAIDGALETSPALS